jgi:transglutaminase-like putative cysteine protease
MKRRDFLLKLSSVAPAASMLGLAARTSGADSMLAGPPPSPGAGWRTFQIDTTVEILEPAGRTLLWIPLPSAARTDYQRLLDTRFTVDGDGGHAEIVTAPAYDVSLLQVQWSDPKSIGPVTLTNRVTTRDRQVNIASASVHAQASGHESHESKATLDTYLRPTKLLPTDGIVKETAIKITRGAHGDVEKARALYEWVVDNTSRDPKTPGCGLGDVASMLKSGYLGGKCADLNGLFVAMCRSLEIPARDSYGVRIADSRRGYECLGKSGDVSKAQHCRAEFHTAGLGWVPVDPADVRKVILEEPPGNLTLKDAKVRDARSTLFGGWEMNWIVYNHGHDVALPGSRGLPVSFLMYPNGETTEGRLDSLNPASFHYEIHSREIEPTS